MRCLLLVFALTVSACTYGHGLEAPDDAGAFDAGDDSGDMGLPLCRDFPREKKRYPGVNCRLD